MPAAHQRSTISPPRQRFTLREWSRQISIIDSTALVERRVRARVGFRASGSGSSPHTTMLKWKKVTLPKGLKLSSAGVLSGTPSAKLAAPSSVMVQVTQTVITLNGKKKI